MQKERVDTSQAHQEASVEQEISPLQQFQRGWDNLFQIQDQLQSDRYLPVTQDSELAGRITAAFSDVETALPSAGFNPRDWYPLFRYFSNRFVDSIRSVHDPKQEKAEVSFNVAIRANVNIEMRLEELQRESHIPVAAEERFHWALNSINTLVNKIHHGDTRDVEYDLSNDNISLVYTDFMNAESSGLACGIEPKALYKLLRYHSSVIASQAGPAQKSRGVLVDIHALAKRYEEIDDTFEGKTIKTIGKLTRQEQELVHEDSKKPTPKEMREFRKDLELEGELAASMDDIDNPTDLVTFFDQNEDRIRRTSCKMNFHKKYLDRLTQLAESVREVKEAQKVVELLESYNTNGLYRDDVRKEWRESYYLFPLKRSTRDGAGSPQSPDIFTIADLITEIKLRLNIR